MIIDFTQSTPLQIYKILSNTITPRPIAWVSTIFTNGLVNLAPFSFFAPISINPPILSLCMMSKSDGSQKDSYQNVINTRKATISMCDIAYIQALDSSGKEIPANVSEAVEFNIPLEVLDSGFPPVPKGIKVAFMCDLHSVLELGDNKSVLLQVHSSYIEENIYNENLNFLPNFVGRVGRFYKSLGTQIMLDNQPANKTP